MFTKSAQQRSLDAAYTGYRRAITDSPPGDIAEAIDEDYQATRAALLVASASEAADILAPFLSRMNAVPAPAQPNPIQTAAIGAIKVREYKDVKEYERDAAKMTADGYVPQGQTASEGHMNVGRTAARWALVGPFALIGGGSRTKGKITVTWMKASA